MAKINLGDEAKDSVTGFQGIAIARCDWLHGCTRITLQPTVDKDGKLRDTATFDEPSLILVKAAKVQGDTRAVKTGGSQDDRAALRKPGE